MHIYVSRALKTALVTGGLFAAGATAAHAEVGGTGLDLNAEASVEVVTEAAATEDVLVGVDATLTDAITDTGTGEVVSADAEVDVTGDASNEVVDVDAELLGGDLSEEQAADATDPATVDADVAIGDTGDSGTGTGTGETGAGTETGVIGIGTDEVVNADAEVDVTGGAANEVVDVDAELLGGDLSEEQAADAADPATVDVDVEIGGTDGGVVGTDDVAAGADDLARADVEVDLTGDASNEVVDVDAELLGGDLSEEQAADAADPATVDVDLAIGGTDTDTGGGTESGTDTEAGTDTDAGAGGVVIVDAEIDFGVDSADKTAGDEAVVSTGGGALGTGVLGAGRMVTVANLTHALTASGGPLPQMSGTEAAALTTGSLPATGADGRTLGGLAVLLMVAGLALTRRLGVQIS